MKKNILLIISMLVCATTSMAQVQEFNISAQNNSIIRSVKGDSVLVYTEESPGNGYFLLYRDGDPTAQAFQLLPGYNVQVRDVRIHDGKTAYFCGTMNPGLYNYAVVGQFNIADVFSGTGTVQWDMFHWMSNLLLASDLTRLDLFECHDTVCMAMTGKSYYDMSWMMPSTTVASAWFDGTHWYKYAHLNKLEKMRFTDVASVDRMILAVGTSEYDTGGFVKPFRKTPDFPMHPVSTNTTTGLSYRSPVGEVLVDHVSRDSVVIAHFDKASGMNVVLHLFTLNSAGVPQVPIKTWDVPLSSTSVFGSGEKLHELKSVGGTAYLLHTGEYSASAYPTMRDWLLYLDYINYPPAFGFAVVTPLKLWNPLIGRQRSMDTEAGHLRFAGVDVKWLETYSQAMYSPSANTCSVLDSVTAIYNKAGIYQGDILDDAFSESYLSYYSVPMIFTVNVNIICNLKGKEEEQ